jgi:hypothetical protein
MNTVASIFGNDPAKAAKTVGKTQQELTDFNKKFSFKDVISTLQTVSGYPNVFTNGKTVESIDDFVNNIKAFFDAVNGIASESKI